MSSAKTTPDAPIASPPGCHVIPERTVGWWALGLSAIGLASWVVLPIITMAFRETYPITDTAVMPAIGVVLVDAAAIFDLLCVFRWKERPALVVVATAVTVLVALFVTFVVVGEGLAAAGRTIHVAIG